MIGLLDSGVGGLSIYKAIKNRLPETKIIYLADKKGFPYGEKSEEELEGLVETAIAKLLDSGANIIVLACNSATVTTIARMRKKFKVPIIGIEPAIKQAAASTKTKHIGVMATTRTIENHDGDILAIGCDLVKSHNGQMVSNIENRFKQISDEELRDAMEPFMGKNVDSIVLGCTHYHFIRNRLGLLYPEIAFFTPEESVVDRLLDVIYEKEIKLEAGSDIFLVTSGKDSFRESLNSLLEMTNADIREI